MHLRNNKFIINCAARSGSTMLVNLLRSNPQVLCHGEVIGADRIGHIAGTYGQARSQDSRVDETLAELRRADPVRFLYDVVFDAQGRKVVGFKFKTDEALDPRHADIATLIREDRDIKVVHLRRRNVLDQYISHQVVLHQTGMTLLKEGEDRPEVQPFEVDVRSAVEYVLDVLRREAESEHIYSGHRSFAVDYEDVSQDGHPSLEGLQAFLDVAPRDLTTPTRKILQRNDTLVTNIDDLREALRLMGLADRC